MTEKNPASYSTLDETHVEFIVDVNQMTLRNVHGEIIQEVPHIPRPQFNQLMESFDYYLQNGPGLYNIDTDDHHIETPNLRLLSRYMPPDVFRYGNLHEPEGTGIRTTWIVYFGNLAISGRRAWDAERLAYQVQEAERKEQELARQRALVEAADNNKTDYLRYDRAVMELGRQSFTFHFEDIANVIAYRVLRDIQQSPEGTRFSLAEAQRTIWEEMPVIERLLFTGGDENKAYSLTSSALHSAIRHVRDGLLTEFHILEPKSFKRTAATYDLNLFVEPELEGGTQESIPVYPPGTPHTVLDETHTTRPDVDDTTLQQHAADLTRFLEKRLLQPAEAIALLDIIMNREGKIALLHLYKKEFPRKDITELRRDITTTLTTLHRKAKRTLGETGYTTARVSRTIAGNTTTGANAPVQQIGGRLLPDRTKELRFKGWVIGRPSTLRLPSVVHPPVHKQK